jgi:hypothetical protein
VAAFKSPQARGRNQAIEMVQEKGQSKNERKYNSHGYPHNDVADPRDGLHQDHGHGSD